MLYVNSVTRFKIASLSIKNNNECDETFKFMVCVLYHTTQPAWMFGCS